MIVSRWTKNKHEIIKVKDDNSETLDIFEPAMHNLFDTAGIVIDTILEGKM